MRLADAPDARYEVGIMPANSLPRRVVKKLLAPVLGERSYAVFQALAMGWDIKFGVWFEEELELIPLAVKAGESAIDIGANFGLYAYHLSRAAGSRGKVYCFEPIPFTATTFRYIARALSFTDVELVQKGCGEKSERVTFTVPVVDSGAISAGLVHMARNDDRAGAEGKALYAQFDKTKKVECDVVAIDEYLPPLDNVSLVKCDIEGADLFAMRGAKRMLERNHPTIIIEINTWFLAGFDLTVHNLVEFFEGLGYRLYIYEKGRLQPIDINRTEPCNWVAIHPSRRSRFASKLPAEA